MHFNQRSVNKLLVHVKATWKPELLISESLISFPPHHDPLPALFFLLELKTLSAGSLQGCRMLSRLWSSLALSLIIICSGWRCQLNACEVKIQTVQQACPERAEQTDESKLSEERRLFSLSALFSLQQIPRPSFSSEPLLFTCFGLLFNHAAFHHLPTPVTDHAD